MQSPKVQNRALNHIGLWVDDLDDAVKELTAKGIQFTPGGIRQGASECNTIRRPYKFSWLISIYLGGHNICFVHPKSATGVLLELVQAPKDLIEKHREWFPILIILINWRRFLLPLFYLKWSYIVACWWKGEPYSIFLVLMSPLASSSCSCGGPPSSFCLRRASLRPRSLRRLQ